MTSNNKKIRFIFITESSVFLAVSIVLFLIPTSVPVNIAAVFFVIFFLFKLLLLSGYARYIPLPASSVRFININIYYPPAAFIGRIFGFDPDRIKEFFITLNNSLVKRPTGKILILLPRCLQNSECAQDLSNDISNCIACGKCQVAEIIEFTGAKNVKVVLAGGGRQALEEINSYNPDSIIAIACEAELIDGIRAVTNRPVWAIANERPEGPCKNTSVEIDYIKDLL